MRHWAALGILLAGDLDATGEELGTMPPFAAPMIPDAIVPGILPWGFTNPIFVGLGGDGWTPPGL